MINRPLNSSDKTSSPKKLVKITDSYVKCEKLAWNLPTYCLDCKSHGQYLFYTHNSNFLFLFFNWNHNLMYIKLWFGEFKSRFQFKKFRMHIKSWVGALKSRFQYKKFKIWTQITLCHTVILEGEGKELHCGKDQRSFGFFSIGQRADMVLVTLALPN